jgi:endonuclease/exonuclease/phosphatase family metal-dependent hydrolase
VSPAAGPVGPVVGPAVAPDLHVMTYNVRRRLPTALCGRSDRWRARAPLLAGLIAAERPTVLGLQEALADQTAVVVSALGPRYSSVGAGRDADGGGEATPVVFDSERLELVDWRQLALSRTPLVAGSRSWGAPWPRILVEALFRDRATGAQFRVVNTHLDAVSPRSRLESARMIARLVGEGGSGPAIVMGDANAPVGSAPYRALTGGQAGGGAGLRDTWRSAGRRLTPEWRTYSGYRAPRLGGRRMDWLLVTPDVDVRAAAINAARFDGFAASDHEPVQALLRFPRLI